MRHHPSGYIGKDKNQDICTPSEVVEPLYIHIGGPFDLDAFDSRKTRHSIIRAKRKVRWPKEDGLVIRWTGSVWSNSPFAILGAALRKAWEEVCSLENATEAFIHGPFRSHRKYWKFFWRAQAVCYLDRIRYIGWDDDFPFPTIVVYYGPHAERFMHCMRHLGVVRPLTPWHARHTMTTVSVSKEYENKLCSVVIEIARAHPELSLVQLREQIKFKEDDWTRLINTPLGELVASGTTPDVEPAAGRNGVPKKNGVAAKSSPKASKRKSPPRAGDADATIKKYLTGKKKGFQFKTADLITMTGLGRNSVLRKLEPYTNVKQKGAGRGAYFEVTK